MQSACSSAAFLAFSAQSWLSAGFGRPKERGLKGGLKTRQQCLLFFSVWSSLALLLSLSLSPPPTPPNASYAPPFGAAGQAALLGLLRPAGVARASFDGVTKPDSLQRAVFALFGKGDRDRQSAGEPVGLGIRRQGAVQPGRRRLGGGAPAPTSTAFSRARIAQRCPPDPTSNDLLQWLKSYSRSTSSVCDLLLCAVIRPAFSLADIQT